MKLWVRFFLFSFIFVACSNPISDEVVKKYEYGLNKNIDSINENASVFHHIIGYDNVIVNADQFICKPDGDFVLCENSKWELFRKDFEGEKTQYAQAKSLTIRTNELYLGEGNISLKAAFSDMLKRHKNIQYSLKIKALKLSDDRINDLKERLAIFNEDAKILQFLYDLVEDSYDIEVAYAIAKSKEGYGYSIDYKLSNAKENQINISLKGSLDEAILNLMNESLYFDTATQNLNIKTLENEKVHTYFSEALKHINLKNFTLESALQTNDVFKSYIEAGKAMLEIHKGQTTNKKQASFYSKLTAILSEMIKDPLYKINLQMIFKNIPLSDAQDPKNIVEKIILNGKDLSEILNL